MLHRKFELIPIKFGFFTNFLSCSKIWQKSLYYSTWSLAKFHQKWLRENSPFLLHFLMHIHVLILYRNFELIPIKTEFFYEFLKLLKNRLYGAFGQIFSKIVRRKFFNFITFSDTHTCTYVV